LDLSDEWFPFRVRPWGSEPCGLAGPSGNDFMGQMEPLVVRAGAPITERADDLLAGSVGCPDAFDEKVVEIGLALVSPPSFAEAPICKSVDKTLLGRR
jgi:hypothetical protein